jgi:hypothetical protein
MATAWATSCREGWLAHLYGEDSGTGINSLSPESVQWQLVGVLDDMLSDKASPKDSAARSASLIISQEDPETLWDNHMGLHLSAAENFADEWQQQALVDYIVELASLPDAMNKGPDIKTWKDNTGPAVEIVRIAPGENIVVHEGQQLWRDVPGFSLNVAESIQGE